ncbi:MFS transporter [Opitutaceae bacterium TAV4]|uniref:MFS transporter n=1 Tax=Geminisphaera colitermitum TaxID=1148786 RepID=UPI00019651A1|nr:MFS transporter [Geminisphaera colitermitum]RRJ94444.1 MFS transporter [Opitutaceae bacterium TAV4]RRJ98572.1 MFS transporter [Opitutaceae bacterium TAV3]
MRSSQPSNPSATQASTRPYKEGWLLLTLAAVQFTHIMDFMIMLPLGSYLMEIFSITPGQFSRIVASYGLSAAVTGFIAGVFIDYIPRRRALLILYAGFAISTLGCAIAPTHHWLLLARIVAGAFGGVAGSVVVAMVGDVIPIERRGRGMAVVQAAFPLASILGLPAGLYLVAHLGWHSVFFLLAVLSAIVWGIAWRSLPHVSMHTASQQPLRQMREMLTHRVHVRGFVVTAVLIFGGAATGPFMAPSMVANVGFSKDQLSWIYLCGGGATFATTYLFGWLSDRFDKLHVLACVSIFTITTVLYITRMGPTPVPVALIVTTLFFVTMSGRFAPTMTMVANAVEPRYRGGFMSVNSAIQQASGAFATIFAGWMMSTDPVTGKLLGYDRVGIISSVGFLLTVVAAAWLRRAAPYAARNRKCKVAPGVSSVAPPLPPSE